MATQQHRSKYDVSMKTLYYLFFIAQCIQYLRVELKPDRAVPSCYLFIFKHVCYFVHFWQRSCLLMERMLRHWLIGSRD